MPSLKQVLFLAKEYLHYWLHCVDEHSLQTPYLFQFYTDLIKGSKSAGIPAIESIRSKLLSDHRLISVRDPGAGTTFQRKDQRKISFIARSSSSQLRFSLMMGRIIRSLQPQNILELGTSLGINTLYMATAAAETDKEATVHTVEGSPNIASLARQNFEKTQSTNVHLHEGDLDLVLQPLLTELPSVDLAYLDANHTYEATMRYFEWILDKIHDETLLILDDIHWSPGMKRAWQKIIRHERVTTSVDLFDAGILFFRPGLQKQHLVLRF